MYTGQPLVIPVAGRPIERGASQVISKGTLPIGSKQIALTFDSGWLYEQTIPLLDVLDQYSVTATFFPRALWVKDHPDLAREIVFRGHTMGNHSLAHSHMKELSADQICQEMRQSTEIIQSTTGISPYLFRPPYGEYNQRMLDVLGREGYPYTIMWTVDTHDWADKIGGKTVTVDYVVNRVLENACPNAIMLMHVGGPKTVQALPRIITGLRDMGYTFTTVDKLLPPPQDNLTIHVVKPGETLYSIAQKYGVTVQQIISANNL
ncbi:MAG TPA: polysaccharide deacetylase family protein [Firmicutes bacterium]|nr:polysaccharide deacetylase family protein [Bacillota bacterium]